MTYNVVLSDGSHLKVDADDVNLDTCGGDNECPAHWWNFTIAGTGTKKDGPEITVAAIPFSHTRYITRGLIAESSTER